MTPVPDTRQDRLLDDRRRRTVVWIVAIATGGLMFDGYDLVVYGTVVSTFLRNPTEIGRVTPALAGALGSYALIGVLVGALLAGTVGDIIGRRKVLLFAYAWFSIGMGVTALTHTTTLFGAMRFVSGLGIGALVATTGALVSEFAPAGKKNLANAITYSGVPLGSLLAAFLAILLLAEIKWRGMFWIGALPVVTLLPLAFFKMSESPAWLVARGFFLVGAASIAWLTLRLPPGVLLAIVAIVGLGTSGTQTLIYGFVANYYRTNVRGAGVSWCAGFGRLGGVAGPLLGGFLIGAGLALNSIFYVLAALALLGMVLTLLVPHARRRDVTRTLVEPTPAQPTAVPG